jgi:hypothetical protein
LRLAVFGTKPNTRQQVKKFGPRGSPRLQATVLEWMIILTSFGGDASLTTARIVCGHAGLPRAETKIV